MVGVEGRISEKMGVCKGDQRVLDGADFRAIAGPHRQAGGYDDSGRSDRLGQGYCLLEYAGKDFHSWRRKMPRDGKPRLGLEDQKDALSLPQPGRVQRSKVGKTPGLSGL